MISDAVHHWDENGLFRNETVDIKGELLPPQTIRDVQSEEVKFLVEWMEQWKQECDLKGRGVRQVSWWAYLRWGR